MYGDDIQVYAEFDQCSQTDVGQTLQRLSDCVRDIQNWMFANKLKLNHAGRNRIHHLCISCPSSKASACLIASWWPHHNIPGTISPSDSRLLGYVLNKQMSMTDQVTNVLKSVNFHSRNISRIRKFIEKDTCHSVVSISYYIPAGLL